MPRLLSSLCLKPPASWPGGIPPAPPTTKAAEQPPSAHKTLHAELVSAVKAAAVQAAQLKDNAARAAAAAALREADATAKKVATMSGNPALKSELLQAAIDEVKAVRADIKKKHEEATALAAREGAEGAVPQAPPGKEPTAPTGTKEAAPTKTTEPEVPKAPPVPTVKVDTKVINAAIRGDGKYGGQTDITKSREAEDGKGSKVKVTGAFGGKVWYEKMQVPYVEPKEFEITFHLDSSVGGGLNRESKSEDGKNSLTAGVEVKAELKFTHTRRLPEKEAKAYTDAIDAGQGGKGKWKEIQAAGLIVKGSYGEAKALLSQVGKVIEGKGLDLDDLGDGDTKDVTGTAKASGKVGGTAGGAGMSVTLEAGISKNGSVSRTVRRVGITFEITLSAMQSLGKDGTLGASAEGIGMKHKRTKEEATSEEVTFFIDMKDPRHNEKVTAILAAGNAGQLLALRNRFKDIASIGRKSKNAIEGADTSASALGVSLRTNDISAKGESEIIGPDGKKIQVKTGSGTQGMDLSVKGERLVHTRTSEIVAGADADNKGFGRSQGKETETDLIASAKGLYDAVAKRDMATLKAIKRGDKKLLKEATEAEGVVLSDASFEKIIKSAANDSAWKKELMKKGWDADAETVKDWMLLRPKIAKAGDSRAEVAELLSQFESKPGRGRHATVKTAVSGTGSGFEFPKSLISKQAIYDRLVTSDPVAPALAGGDKAACLVKLKQAQQQLDGLRKDIFDCKEKFKNEGDKHEMLDAIDDRRNEVRAATEKLAGKDGKSEEQEQGRVANQVRELKEKIADAVKTEKETFALWAEDVKGGFFSGVDIIKLDAHMKLLRGLYPKWDADVEKLRKLLALAGPGFDAASADQLKPNRVRYRELRAKTPDKSGSMQTDGV